MQDILLTFCTKGVMPVELDVEGRQRPAEVVPPALRLALEIVARIDSAVEIGESDGGVRRYIPITGGYFYGPSGIQGEVVPGGADWQLVRPDGALELEAVYALRTKDGVNISVRNFGLIVRGDGDDYVMTSPVFHAPRGSYEWLNHRKFVGNVMPVNDGAAVVVRVFEAYQPSG